MCKNKRLRTEELIEGKDFYWEERHGARMRVFTKEYLKEIRPACCKGGCRHCPWEWDGKP